MQTTKPEAAAAARVGAGLGRRKRREPLELLSPCFARVEPRLQAGKYAAAVMSGLPRRNGWTIAGHAGDRTPDRTQRLPSRACWDTAGAMGVVRRFAVAGLEDAGRRRGLRVGALDETGQARQGTAAAGVKRQHMGCAGGVASGINTVHLSYVREQAGHALAGARQWIPAGHIDDPVKSAAMGLPPDLVFRTRGQLATGILAEASAGGVRLDFVCGDEVYGSCTQLRESLEDRGQGYVPRVAPGLPRHPRQRGEGHLQGGRQPAAGRPAALGDPLRREGLERRAVVCLGVDRHRLPPPPPAGPPAHQDRRAGLPLLPRARGPGIQPEPADPRRRDCAGPPERASSSGRAASDWTSPRSACTPRSPGIPCW